MVTETGVAHGCDKIAGTPPYLGIGFGEAQAKIDGVCMFGARVQLPPTITLGELTQELSNLCGLIDDMAKVVPPEAAQ
ncbi:hypothetical protein ACN26Z_21135 [Verrucosispora sp. WMMD703]|uniref:hypothetical protein n=1 Tax=Verrucosispora sp. WMMD703 TaxID=3403463 RepID=UPI003B9312A3